MVAFFLQFLRFQKRRSVHTIKAYEADLFQFSRFLQSSSDGVLPEDASKPHFRQWIVALASQGFSPASINRKLSSLRAFYQFLVVEGRLAANPMQKITSLKKPKRLPVFVQENNMRLLFENVVFSSDFSGQRDKVVLEILYGTGIRLSELVSLTWRAVDMQSGQIKVLGKRNKERIVPMHAGLKKVLLSYNQLLQSQPLEQSPYVVVTDKGKKAYPMLIERIVKKHLGAVTTEKKKSPHVLRHTFATHLLNAGADINSIKTLLGHSSLAATQVYTHTTVAKLKQAYNQAHPRSIDLNNTNKS